MKKRWQLVELVSDEDILSAQLQFMNNTDIEVVSGEVRVYPYGSVAAQTVGWVGFVSRRDMKMFKDDRLAAYMENEFCGRSGIEYACEAMLRGRRGEEVRTFDNSESNRANRNRARQGCKTYHRFRIAKDISSRCLQLQPLSRRRQ